MIWIAFSKKYLIPYITPNIGTGGTSMNNTMEYKGYLGSVEFSEEDALFYGKILGIRVLVSYEGSTARELQCAYFS